MLLVENEIKYEGYIHRQLAEIRRFKKVEKRLIPDEIDYSKIVSISREAREKLTKIRPASLGQASRIPGLSPTDLSLVSIYVEKMLRAKNEAN